MGIYISKNEMQITATHEGKQRLCNVARQNYILADKSCRTNQPELEKLTARHIDTYSLEKPPPVVVPHKDFYNYVNEEDGNPKLWVSFANKYLGGGFLEWGYVQEEIICLEFYEMATHILENGIPLMAKKEAYLFTNLLRTSIADPQYYGKCDDAVLFQPSSIATAHFLSIDALKRPNRDADYTYGELNHLCVKSLCGFSGCVERNLTSINTGNWGAGVFRNKHEVVYFIQILSAWLAGVKEIHFWGYLEEVGDAVVRLVEESSNVQEFFTKGMQLLHLGDHSMYELYRI